MAFAPVLCKSVSIRGPLSIECTWIRFPQGFTFRFGAPVLHPTTPSPMEMRM